MPRRRGRWLVITGTEGTENKSRIYLKALDKGWQDDAPGEGVIKLLDAYDAGTLTFQVGAGTTANDSLSVTSVNLSADASVSAVTGGAVTDVTTSTDAVTNIDALLTTINTERANWGAVQNRFEAVIGILQVSAENQTAARSRIMDADFAAETAALTRAQVLQQAGTAMLAQANQIPNSVLQLLR